MKTSINAVENEEVKPTLASNELKCNNLYEIYFNSGRPSGEYLYVDFIGKRILITKTGELVGGENITVQYSYKRSTKVLTLTIQN